MKKIVLFVFLAFAMGACKKTATTETTETKVEETSTSVPMPETESSAVKDYMQAYDAYLIEYTEAMKTKDQAKMVVLGNKGKELSAKGSEALKQAQGDDLTKLTEYMKAKTDEFVAISQGKY